MRWVQLWERIFSEGLMVKWGIGWSKVESQSCDEKDDELLEWWLEEDAREWEEWGLYYMVIFKLDQKKYFGCGVWSVELRKILVVDFSLVTCLIIFWIFCLVACFFFELIQKFLKGWVVLDSC